MPPIHTCVDTSSPLQPGCSRKLCPPLPQPCCIRARTSASFSLFFSLFFRFFIVCSVDDAAEEEEDTAAAAAGGLATLVLGRAPPVLRLVDEFTCTRGQHTRAKSKFHQPPQFHESISLLIEQAAVVCPHFSHRLGVTQHSPAASRPRSPRRHSHSSGS